MRSGREAVVGGRAGSTGAGSTADAAGSASDPEFDAEAGRVSVRDLRRLDLADAVGRWPRPAPEPAIAGARR